MNFENKIRRCLPIFMFLDIFQIQIHEQKYTKKNDHDEYGPLRINVFGKEFPNPVGLAAGYDKNAEAINTLLGLGFGFIEVGSITPEPQPGNEKPRMFRLSKNYFL